MGWLLTSEGQSLDTLDVGTDEFSLKEGYSPSYEKADWRRGRGAQGLFHQTLTGMVPVNCWLCREAKLSDGESVLLASEGSFLPCELVGSGITAEQQWGEKVIVVTELTNISFLCLCAQKHNSTTY